MVRGQSMSENRGRRVRLPRSDRAADRLRGGVGQPFHQLVDHLLHHLPGGVLGLFGDRGAQADQVGDEMNVGLQRREKFRLQHHGLEVQPLEGIALDHLHHGGRKELADVAEPAGDARGRAAEAALPGFALALGLVIEGAERAIHAQIALRESLLVVAAERQPPTAAPLGLGARLCITHDARSPISSAAKAAPARSPGCRARRREPPAARRFGPWRSPPAAAAGRRHRIRRRPGAASAAPR